VGLAAERAGRRASRVRLPALRQLQINWREIAGEEIWRWTQPARLSGSREGRILTLTVLAQAAPFIQHQSETIRQRVSVAAGGDVVAIRLVHGIPRPAGRPQPQRPSRTLRQSEIETLEAQAARISDPRLRAAIVALGKAVLSAEM
ncbi:MAG: hypothetical protein ACO33A_12760, partial [Hyphomonas sp.]